MRQIPLSIFGRNAKPMATKPDVENVTAEEPVLQEKPVEEAPVKEVELKEEPVVLQEEPKVEETNTEPVTKEDIPEVVEIDLSSKEIREEPVPEQNNTEEEQVKEEQKESETPVAEEPEEPKKKRTRKSSAEKPAEVQASMKLTGASKLPDAIALVIPEYEDPSYNDFMEHMNEALLHTVFDERADAGVIKVVLSNLARCYDNATRKYADVSAKLETVANKQYGLIVRQTAVNSLGNNDAERKRNGLHAPEIYKGTGGKTVNLFAVEAGLRKQALELQTIIKQIEFKKSAIIAYLTASKQDADV